MATTKLALDHIGWTYIGISIGWTVILAAAMVFLWYHRKLPYLQMRRLPLVFSAMIMLHLYGVLCFIGYVIGPVAPCAAEYWVMSILVPFGIALFQVANTQFLYIASQQRRFTSVRGLKELVREKRTSPHNRQTSTLWQRSVGSLSNPNQITRMVVFVGFAMTVQAVLALLIFLMSRKFHPEFGVLPANLFGTDAEQRLRCSRGWEWWLSIVWQFFWAWLYAPYILWKSRNVKDTHGWRTQTILCCVAGLPCSPLWLAGLYLPEFMPMNMVFVPPQWFSISIMFIQAFTLLIPCYQVFRHHNLRAETLAAIADWEAKNKLGSIDSDSTKVKSHDELAFKTCAESERGILHVRSGKDTGERSINSRKSHLYTMVALEHALKWNPEPLQKFAALKDFSGENISFLTHLQSWKQAWSMQEREKYACKVPSERDAENDSDQRFRGQFNKALRLYAAFVSGEHAEFPINISSRMLKDLDDMFAGPAELLFGDSRSQSSYNSATPFDAAGKSEQMIVLEARVSRASHDTFEPDDVWYWGDIPAQFGQYVFDDSENEIKYLVLTNTWPKFVNAGCAEQIQDTQGRSFSRRLSLFFNSRGNSS